MLKKKMARNSLIALVSGLLGANTVEASGFSPLGFWKTEDGRAKIEVFNCGKKVCGKIVALKEPNDPKTAQPKLDVENPDENLRKRPLMGLQIVQNFTQNPSDPNHWEKGEIYSPKEGKTYSAEMTMKDANTIDLRGYVLITMIGRTQTWKRMTPEQLLN